MLQWTPPMDMEATLMEATELLITPDQHITHQLPVRILTWHPLKRRVMRIYCSCPSLWSIRCLWLWISPSCPSCRCLWLWISPSRPSCRLVKSNVNVLRSILKLSFYFKSSLRLSRSFNCEDCCRPSPSRHQLLKLLQSCCSIPSLPPWTSCRSLSRSNCRWVSIIILTIYVEVNLTNIFSRSCSNRRIRLWRIRSRISCTTGLI